MVVFKQAFDILIVVIIWHVRTHTPTHVCSQSLLPIVSCTLATVSLVLLLIIASCIAMSCG